MKYFFIFLYLYPYISGAKFHGIDILIFHKITFQVRIELLSKIIGNVEDGTVRTLFFGAMIPGLDSWMRQL